MRFKKYLNFTSAVLEQLHTLTYIYEFINKYNCSLTLKLVRQKYVYNCTSLFFRSAVLPTIALNEMKYYILLHSLKFIVLYTAKVCDNYIMSLQYGNL